MSHTYCIIALNSVTYKILSQLLRYEIILKLTDSRDTVALEGEGVFKNLIYRSRKENSRHFGTPSVPHYILNRKAKASLKRKFYARGICPVGFPEGNYLPA